MDIISSINSAFTQVQRFENMSFGTNGNNTQVSYRERESVNNLAGLPGGRGGMQNFLPASSENSVSSAVQQAVAYDRSQGGSLQLRTQEGDIVKLKFLNSESANAQNQQFESGGTTLTDFSLSGSNSSQFKVVVEGDLNGEELNAIRNVLIQAREMANTFFEGEVKQAFSMAGQMDIDSDQLANVNMQLNVRETYTYAQASIAAPVVEPPGDFTQPVAPAVESAPTAPAAQPVATQPATQPQVAAVAPNAVDTEDNTVVQEAPVQPEPLETAIHTAPDPVGGLAGALSTITGFLNQLTESLNSFNEQFMAPNQSGNSGFSFTAGFQLQLVGTLIGQLDNDASGQASPASELAAKTIDELAMKMDSFVDATA